MDNQINLQYHQCTYIFNQNNLDRGKQIKYNCQQIKGKCEKNYTNIIDNLSLQEKSNENLIPQIEQELQNRIGASSTRHYIPQSQRTTPNKKQSENRFTSLENSPYQPAKSNKLYNIKCLNCKKQIEQRNVEVNQLNQTIRNKQQELRSCKYIINQQNLAIDKLKETQSNQNQQNQSEVKALNKQILEFQEQLSNINYNNSMLEQKLNEYRRLNQEYTENNAKIESELAQVKTKYQELLEEQTAFENPEINLKLEINYLQLQNQRIIQEMYSLEKQCKEKGEKINIMEQEFKHLMDKISNEEQYLNSCESNKIQEYELQLDFLQQQNKLQEQLLNQALKEKMEHINEIKFIQDCQLEVKILIITWENPQGSQLFVKQGYTLQDLYDHITFKREHFYPPEQTQIILLDGKYKFESQQWGLRLNEIYTKDEFQVCQGIKFINI